MLWQQSEAKMSDQRLFPLPDLSMYKGSFVISLQNKYAFTQESAISQTIYDFSQTLSQIFGRAWENLGQNQRFLLIFFITQNHILQGLSNK